MKVPLLTLALIASTSVAYADTTSFGNELGNLLASESVCGLKYRRGAIQELVRKQVGGDMVEFATTLSLLTSNAAFTIHRMSASAQAAHCAQMRVEAKALGFLD